MRSIVTCAVLFISCVSHAQEQEEQAPPAPPLARIRLAQPQWVDAVAFSDLDVVVTRASVGQLDINQQFMLNSYTQQNKPLVDYIASPHIQQQIELSKTQKKQVNEIRKRMHAGLASLGKKYHERIDITSSKKIRDKAKKEMAEESKELRSKYEAEVKETLIPHQVNLIQQLKFQNAVQMFGFTHAVSNAPFNEEIKATDEQKKELAKIKTETEKAIQKKIAEMRTAAKEKMLKVLDAGQRKTIKGLEGDKKKTPSPKL